MSNVTDISIKQTKLHTEAYSRLVHNIEQLELALSQHHLEEAKLDLALTRLRQDLARLEREIIKEIK